MIVALWFVIIICTALIAFGLGFVISSIMTRSKQKTLSQQKIQKKASTELPKIEKQSAEKDNRECLTRLAHYDELTSLPNRIFFHEILNKAISHAKRHKKVLSILFIDIDSSPGNEALKELGNRFSNTLRTEDILAKLDGDEFIVLLNDIGKAKFAGSVAEKLLKVCSEPVIINDKEFTLTASIGICIYPNDGDSLEDLLKNTDTALYQAKKAGGNSYQFYTQEMDMEAREFIQLETELRKAIQNNELILYYQPKVHIKKGSLVGLEALLRWAHPKLGIIQPAKFIPIAEETGLINEIGSWMLRTVCQTNKKWQDEGYEHLTISINLSPKQFHNPQIIQVIQTALNETGLNPSYLELEITEKTVMDDLENATIIFNKIKDTGVRLSIDHFGVGQTSISHLKQFPLNTVKIDQSYVKGVPNNPNDCAITNALVALVHSLGFEVVAEGVETAEQVQYLAAQNCDLVQGYFLSHPLPAEKIILQFKKLMDEILL